MGETKKEQFARKVYGIYLPNDDDSNAEFVRMVNSVEECVVTYESQETNKTQVLTKSCGDIECLWCFQISKDFVQVNGEERMFQYFETMEEYQKEKDSLIAKRIEEVEKNSRNKLSTILKLAKEIEFFDKELAFLYASVGETIKGGKK